MFIILFVAFGVWILTVSGDEYTTKVISARIRDLISQYQVTFENLSWKYQAILAKIPETVEQIQVLQALQEQIGWKVHLANYMVISNLTF